MSEELERLQSLGAQRIHRDTHISLKHVQDILRNNFESFSKIQFIGFISILQREYELNLDALKDLGIAYFDEEENKKSGVFVAPKKKKNNYYIFIIFAIFIAVIVYRFSILKVEEPVNTIDNVSIESSIKHIDNDKLIIEENNTTDEVNTSKEEIVISKIELEPDIKLEPEIEKSLKIKTQTKVWFGYIDLKTNQKKQFNMKESMSLDPQKDWLLVFGHGYIDIYVNGIMKKFQSRESVRFLYKDNKLTTITFREFKKLNRGKAW